jgi:hypothetical protein
MLDSEHAIWIAPLVVGAVVMILGYILLSRGRKQLQADSMVPQRTVQSLQRDARLAKEHVQ